MIEYTGRDSYHRKTDVRISTSMITFAERLHDGTVRLGLVSSKYGTDIRDAKEAARVWEELRIAWTSEVRP